MDFVPYRDDDEDDDEQVSDRDAGGYADTTQPQAHVSEDDINRDPGVWLLQEGWLWHCNGSGRRRMYECPASADVVPDGIGGVYAMIAGWIWHFGRNHSKKKCKASMDSKLCGDAVGGCWFISDGTLWHLLHTSLRKLYDFPTDVMMAPDGLGSVWILDEDTLYYCSEINEARITSFPPNSVCRLQGDGVGGMWAQTDTGDASTTGIWHCSKARKTFIAEMPRETEICSDGVGGLWCVFDHSLWLCKNANKVLTKKYAMPPHADIESDGEGGVWALFDGWIWRGNAHSGFTQEKLQARRNMSIHELREKSCLVKVHKFPTASRLVGAM